MAEIYSKCEIKSKESPDIYLDEYINSLNISAHYNQPLSRNPKTKVESIITSRKVVKFKPSVYIKKKINS